MIVKIEISQNKELKRKMELYYKMYIDYNTNYLISVLTTDKDWNKRKANMCEQAKTIWEILCHTNAVRIL